MSVRGSTLAGGVLVVAFAALAVVGWFVDPDALDPAAGRRSTPPGPAHVLGTDDLGRDIAVQLALGARVSLTVALIAASLACGLGTLVGLVAGSLGGWPDRVLSRILDVALALPFLPLVLVLGAYLGRGPLLQAVLIGLLLAAHTARVIRSQALEVRGRGHVVAARAMGAGLGHLARWHLVPAVTPLVIPQFVRVAGTALLAEASLSFLGLGDPTVPSWGTMLAFAQARGALLTDAWQWWVVPPGLCITLTLVGLALLGAGLEERARPQLRQARTGAGRRMPLQGSAPGPTRAATSAEPIPELSAPVAERSAPVGPAVAPAVGPAVAPAVAPVLEVAALRIGYRGPDGIVVAVEAVDLRLDPGETVGIVGESGAGKTSLVMSLLGLLPPTASVSGEIRLDGRRLADLSGAELHGLRGDRIALVPQNAMHALDPVIDVRSQIVEVIRAHRRVDRVAARRRASGLLELVGIAPDRMTAFPHELSGGMRQRVVIAMALANDPAVLIADEPTTGLDVVLQAGIVALLRRLGERAGLAILLVSHDLPMVLGLADRVLVMRAGRVVESGPTSRIAHDPQDAYTRTLLAAVPKLDRGAA